MYDCLLVLIDESDALLKADALQMLARLMAQTEAGYAGDEGDAEAIVLRAEAFERKLRRVISLGSP